MTNFSTSPNFARELDRQDVLASFRNQFVINDRDLIYLDGNSLGMMPKIVQERACQVVKEQWGTDLIRGWNKGWWDAPHRIGDKIGQLIGAAAGQTVVGDTVSINLFKLATAALAYQPTRTGIITDTFNFPSDLYILQGINQTLGSRHKITLIGAIGNDITPDLAALEHRVEDVVHAPLDAGELDGVRVVAPGTIAAFTALQDSTLSHRALGLGEAQRAELGGAPAVGAGVRAHRVHGDLDLGGPVADVFIVLLTNRVNPTRARTGIAQVRVDLADAVVAMTAPLVSPSRLGSGARCSALR